MIKIKETITNAKAYIVNLPTKIRQTLVKYADWFISKYDKEGSSNQKAFETVLKLEMEMSKRWLGKDPAKHILEMSVAKLKDEVAYQKKINRDSNAIHLKGVSTGMLAYIVNDFRGHTPTSCSEESIGIDINGFDVMVSYDQIVNELSKRETNE